jgi:FMN phosphatase YigB (HAD superfamily)
MLEHISFDIDGTLYHEKPKLKRFKSLIMAVAIARQKGKKVSEAFRKDYCRFFEKVHSHTQVMRRFNLSGPSYTILENLDLSGFVSEDKLLCTLLEGLREDGLPLSWYSSNSRKGVLNILETLGVNPDLFEFGISGEDIPKSCEDNRGYIEIIKRAHAEGAEHRVLYVGDRATHDIQPAQSAGLTTALVLWNSSMNEPFRNPNLSSDNNREYEIKDIYAVRNLVDHLMSLK